MIRKEKEKLIQQSMRKEKLRKVGFCFITGCFIKPFKMIINLLFFVICQAHSKRNFGFLISGISKRETGNWGGNYLSMTCLICLVNVMICIFNCEKFIYGTFEDCIGLFNSHYCSFYFRILALLWQSSKSVRAPLQKKLAQYH